MASLPQDTHIHPMGRNFSQDTGITLTVGEPLPFADTTPKTLSPSQTSLQSTPSSKPDLPPAKPLPRRRKRLTLRAIGRYFAADIRDDLFLESQLILLAFATGMQDAASYPDFRCFASNQTGNTVLLAVGYAGLLDPKAFVFRNTWISLTMFVLGALAAGQISNLVGRRRRATCFVSSLVQTAFVIGTVVVAYQDAAAKHQTTAELLHNFTWQTTGGRPYTRVKMFSLGLLAFSSGAQVAMARAVGINEITTAMATSAYVDLLVDPGLIAPQNRSRNRRAIFLLALFAGSFGGAFSSSAYGTQFALMISAIGKVLVTIALLFNKEAERKDDHIGKEGLA